MTYYIIFDKLSKFSQDQDAHFVIFEGSVGALTNILYSA